MDLFVSKSLPLVLVSLSFVAISLSFAAAESKHEFPSPLDKRSEEHPRTASNLQFAKNDMLVGLQDPFFWFLAPLYAFIAVGITVVLNYLVTIILHTGQAMCSAFCGTFGRSNHERRHTGTTVFSTSSPRRRIIVTAFLLLFVATIVPYQFAYMVACLVQLATCIRALKFAKENVSPAPVHPLIPEMGLLKNIVWSQGYGERSGPLWDFYNYSHSILVVMLWILPINLPVLVVWHHNLAVHWLTPFSSHHNLLSIMPFILLVETLTTGNMIPRVTTK